MKRDRTFGTQTSAGSRYVERILTTVATCQQQGVNTLAYLTAAVRAHWLGTPGAVVASSLNPSARSWIAPRAARMRGA